MSTKKALLTFLSCIIMMSFISGTLHAWELPVVIDNQANHTFYKPEMNFGPSGAAYVTYRKKNSGTRNSDIMLATYDGKAVSIENVSELSSRWNGHKAYETDVAIDTDENIHVVWVGHPRANVHNHYIMYRVKKDGVWSQTIDLGAMALGDHDYIFDLRMVVGPNGNVHVVFMLEEGKRTYHIAKFGDVITGLRRVGPQGKVKAKHPDIAINENFVHIQWQEKQGFPYVIMHQKVENKLGGTWYDYQQVTHPKKPWANQKSRIALDQYGNAHFAIFYKSGNNKKLNYWIENAYGSYSKIKNLSDPSQIRLYHFAGLAIKNGSVIGTMQLGDDLGGQGIFYNWQQNGQWSGYLRIPDTHQAAHQSTDLDPEGKIAAVAFARRDQEIILMSSSPIVATGLLEAEFSHPGKLFAASEITFDASQCPGLNPDFNIVQYTWDFGDGHIETSSNPSITHTYNVYGFPVEISLTITAATGETGVIKKDFQLHALYSAIVTAANPQTIRSLFFNRPAYEVFWNPNPKNDAAGYPSISRYEIWRAPRSSFAGNGQFIKAGEVNAGSQLRFFDWYGLQKDVKYVYEVRSIDSEGHISPIGNY
jgi:hypothetical protein